MPTARRKTNPFGELSGKQRRHMIKIQQVLSPDLLKPCYRRELNEDDYAQITFGHCYVATEAAYHLFAAEHGFVPYCARARDTTHWWLVNEETGEIIDPTFPQLDGDFKIYEKGARRAFLTKKPSKRARELIRRLKAQDD